MERPLKTCVETVQLASFEGPNNFVGGQARISVDAKVVVPVRVFVEIKCHDERFIGILRRERFEQIGVTIEAHDANLSKVRTVCPKADIGDD